MGKKLQEMQEKSRNQREKIRNLQAELVGARIEKGNLTDVIASRHKGDGCRLCCKFGVVLGAPKSGGLSGAGSG